ncbi:MAG: phosphoglycerate kinase [Carbonactinosporaceae bacterium]
MRTIDDLTVAGRRVLVRADLNVPMEGPSDSSSGGRRITDDGRIRASLPTLRALTERGARVLVCAHLGRPGGKPAPEYSLAPVARRLGELLGRPAAFATDTVGESARAVAAGLADGEVGLLENLRFDARETSRDDFERAAFADRLASLADLYVGDGFGAVHRRHASVFDVPRRLPSAAGRLIEGELAVLRALTTSPARPYVVALGGAKVTDKLGVIDNLIPLVDRLVIGGGMSYTFLAAKGYEVGRSLLDSDSIGTVRGFLAAAEKRGVELVLPVDVVVATELAPDAPHEVVPADAMPADLMGVDIGPDTAKLFATTLADARTVFWNGPMGVFEMAPFAAGTRAVAQALTEVDGLTVVGGGDVSAAVRALGFADAAFGHISTGGGASLEYLEGKDLPGLDALEDRA